MDVKQLIVDVSWALRKQLRRRDIVDASPHVAQWMSWAVVAVGLVGIALVIGGYWIVTTKSSLGRQPGSLRVQPSLPATETETVPDEGLKRVDLEADGSINKISVHVVGCVKRPGLYQLMSSARVADAVKLAGGFTQQASNSGINLAALAQDGTQIYVPSKREVARGQAGLTPNPNTGSQTPIGGATAGSSAAVNINSASQAELEELPGVGPSTAQKIIQDRETNGPYKTIQDLMRVSGVGEKKVQSLEGLAVAN